MLSRLLAPAALSAAALLIAGCGVVVVDNRPPPAELRHIGHIEESGSAPVGEHDSGCRMLATVDAFERENGAVKLVMHLTTRNHARMFGCTGEVKISLMHHHEVINSFFVTTPHNPPVGVGLDGDTVREVERVEWLSPQIHVHALGIAFGNRERDSDPVEVGQLREFRIHEHDEE